MAFNLSRLLLSTALTSLATAAAVALLGKRETGHAAAGINAVSHILWGDDAFQRNRADWAHTALGGGINTAAMLSWSMVGQLLPAPKSLLSALRNGLVISGLAYVTDYYIVPSRLTPGFEHRLSREGLWRTYAVLAASYALADHAATPR